MELMAKSFAVRRSVCAIPQAYHVYHLGGVSLTDFQSMPCNRVGNISMGVSNLVLKGLNFVPLDCAAWIPGRSEEQYITIAAASQRLLPLLTGRSTFFEEVLDLLQFANTTD